MFAPAKLYRGSLPGRRANKERGREAADRRLWEDYFSTNPTYDAGNYNCMPEAK